MIVTTHLPSRRNTLRSAIALVGVLSLAASVHGQNLLFAPPAAAKSAGPVVKESAPAANAEVCLAPRSESFKPSIGRFGFLPPPPLTCAPPPVELPPVKQEKYDFTKLFPEPQAPCLHPDGYLQDFSSGPCWEGQAYDPCAAQDVYAGKTAVLPQRPWVEWGFPFYDNGPVPPSQEWFGPTNLVQQKFYVYGDWRAALAQNNNVASKDTVLAHRLNLDLDYWITSTERVHAFIGPFQEGAQFMRIEDGDYIEELDFFDPNTDTLFFEGDAGQMLGGFEHTLAPFDLPVTFGLVPLLFQNGIWMQDALVGGAVTIPARNSPGLDWSNFDVTMFAGFNHISSGAFGFDENAANVVGATTFIEARGGYIEAGYAFLADNEGVGRSYHNLGLSYTRRYLNLLSNSVRCIVNAGQDGPRDARTADGVLLLLENSLLTKNPYNVIPYVNFFAGFNSPQPVARAGAFGDVLFNTGILFQSDLLTGYPTLDATGNNTYGAALGLDLLASPNFQQQLIVETAVLQVMGDDASRNAPGAQYGVGARYQLPLSKATLIRADVMHGWLEDATDVTGARVEYRWKF